MEIYISIGIAVATIITNIVVSAINNKKINGINRI